MDAKIPLPPQLPPLEHFNLNETGVRILDRTLATKNSRGRIIDITFRPQGILCDYDQTNNCNHIEFALTVPAIREQIRRLKKDQGWRNLPDV